MNCTQQLVLARSPAVQQCVGLDGEALELGARQVVSRIGQLGDIRALEGSKLCLHGLDV